MGDVVTDDGRRARAGGGRRDAGADLVSAVRLLTPHVEATLRCRRGQRVQRSSVGAFVEELGPGGLLRLPDLDGVTVHVLRDPRAGVPEVADHDRLGRADDDAGRLQAHVEAVGAEVAFLSRVVLGIDEDCIVWAGGDAGWVVALVAAGDLEAAPDRGVHADVDGFDVGAGDRERHLVLGLAGRRTGVTADALRLVD